LAYPIYDYIMNHYKRIFRILSIKFAFLLNLSLRKLVHDFSEKTRCSRLYRTFLFSFSKWYELCCIIILDHTGTNYWKVPHDTSASNDNVAISDDDNPRSATRLLFYCIPLRD